MQSATILTPAVHAGDATGQHTIDLVRALQHRQTQVEIVCDSVLGALPIDLQPLLRPGSYHDYVPAADLTILQYPIWFALAERFRRARGATIFWYHGVTPPALWSSAADIQLLQMSERNSELAWHADLAVCDSPFTVEELHRHAGYPRQRLRVVPFGVDTRHLSQASPPETLAQLRSQWQLTHKRVLLYVGRVVGNKRVDLLIDALACLADQYPDLVLLIVGDNHSSAAMQELMPQLAQQTERLNLTNRVIFTGKVGDLAPYYHMADLFVHASQHEGFCVPLIEAMAARLPVIASASGAMPWVLNAHEKQQDSVGLTFTPGDAHALAQQIERLLTDSTLRHTLQERGAQRVVEFDQEHFVRRVADVVTEAFALMPEKLLQSRHDDLYPPADVALRTYRVRSNLPVLGRLIERVRTNSTSHLKEAYLDRIIERQVGYNRLLADEVNRLHTTVARLSAQLDQLRER
ncbi:MAG: glycosyltransferase family 4 protein [Chloroflexota bacterium]|nr:glycosyltransferase family 4 protein [Chloroflexota bacterium]